MGSTRFSRSLSHLFIARASLVQFLQVASSSLTHHYLVTRSALVSCLLVACSSKLHQIRTLVCWAAFMLWQNPSLAGVLGEVWPHIVCLSCMICDVCVHDTKKFIWNVRRQKQHLCEVLHMVAYDRGVFFSGRVPQSIRAPSADGYVFW